MFLYGNVPVIGQQNIFRGTQWTELFVGIIKEHSVKLIHFFLRKNPTLSAILDAVLGNNSFRNIPVILRAFSVLNNNKLKKILV